MTTPTNRATPGQLEQRLRSLDVCGAQIVRAADGEDTAPRFTGHAAVFNSRTSIGDPLKWGFYEELDTGCFDDTLDGGDARFLVDHDSHLLVSRVSAGDLRLDVDSIGLATDSDLDQELSYVRDLTRNLVKKRITGMSFGFRVREDAWSEIDVEVNGADGKTSTSKAYLRVIKRVDLLEVSAVTFPAYEDTDASVRSRLEEARAALGAAAPVPSPRRSFEHLDQRARAIAARYGRP